MALGHDYVSQQAHQVEHVCPRTTHVCRGSGWIKALHLVTETGIIVRCCVCATGFCILQHDQAGSVTLHLNLSSSGREGLRGHYLLGSGRGKIVLWVNVKRFYVT